MLLPLTALLISLQLKVRPKPHPQGCRWVCHSSRRVPEGRCHPSRYPTTNLCSSQNWPWLLPPICTSPPPSTQPLCPNSRIQTLWYHQWMRRSLPYTDQQKGLLAEYGIWNGLEAFSSQTNPEYIVTMSCPGSRRQLQQILNVVVGTEEWGQDFIWKECRDITNCDLDSSRAHLFWLEWEEFCHYAILAACSYISSKTSHVAKLRLQKYWHGIQMVLRLVTTRDRIRGFRALEISGMGKMTLPWKYWAYFLTLSLS